MYLNSSTSIRRAACILAFTSPFGAIAAPSSVVVADSYVEDANMQTARGLYAAIFTARDFAVADRYLGPEYIQHAPDVADGKSGLAKAIPEIAKAFPQVSYDIKRITADGDLVTMMTHIRWTPDSLGTAQSDIYRFSNGKIVEHWEAVQAVPGNSANGNGMF
jgi:predicted SnoaL-like aldol condensation-catalyzing enzyme